jgi:hypothetical protein
MFLREERNRKLYTYGERGREREREREREEKFIALAMNFEVTRRIRNLRMVQKDCMNDKIIKKLL